MATTLDTSIGASFWYTPALLGDIGGFFANGATAYGTLNAQAPWATLLASPGPIGETVANTGTFTNLTASNLLNVGSILTTGTIIATTGTISGILKLPTAAQNTNTQQGATTAFVLGQASSATPLTDGVAATGVATTFSRGDHVHPAIPDTGRNKLHNPLFRVQQRGLGPWTGAGNYTADRWLLGLVNDTVS